MALTDIINIINKYDILTATEDDWRTFDGEYDSWRRKCDELPGPVTLWYDVTTLLSYKVCVPNIPNSKSNGILIAKRIVEIITRHIDDGGYESMEYDQLCSIMFDMMLQFIAFGPGTGHMVIWNAIFDWKSFQKYYKNLTKDKLSKMLKAIKKEFYVQGELDTDSKDYNRKLQTSLLYVVDINVLDLKTNQEEYLDLFMFYLTQFFKSDPATFSTMHTLGMKLWYKFERKPFKGVTNLDIYRKYLKSIQDCLCDKDVPNNANVIKELYSVLRYVLSQIQDDKLFSELYMDLVDFVLTLVNKTSGITAYEHVEAVGSLWCHIKEDQLKNKTYIFDGMAPKIAELLENMKDHQYGEIRLIQPALHDVLGKVMNNSKEHCELWIRIIKLTLPIQGCAEATYYAVMEQEKFLKWKNYQNEAKEIFQLFGKVKVTYADPRKRRDTIQYYASFVNCFLDQLKKTKVLPELFEDIADYSLNILESNNSDFYEVANKVADAYDGLTFKKHKPIIMSSLKRVTKLLRCEHEWNIDRCCTLQEIQCNSTHSMTDFKSLEGEDFDILIDLCDAAISGDFITPDNICGTEHYRIYVTAVFKTFKLLADTGDISKGGELVSKVINLLEHDEENVVQIATNQIYILANGKGGAECLAPYLSKIIEVYLDTENYIMLSVIQLVYPKNGSAVEEQLQRLFPSLDSGESAIKKYTLQLLSKVAEHQPKVFTKDNVDKIMEVMFEGDPNQQVQYLTIVDTLAVKEIQLVLHIIDDLLDKEYNELCLYFLCSILRKIASKSNEKVADRIINRFAKALSGPETHVIIVLGELRSLVTSHKTVVEKHKSLIEKLKDNSHNQTIRDIATSLIDLLEGRSLLTLADDLDVQQGEIENLDDRVTTNQNSVNVLTEDVGEQKKEIKIIKTNVNEQGQKLNELGEVVDETVLKVEEIDQKTLSHAPYWSRDVSKLLNPKSDHDWRLLSSRLGYGNDDIRAWAQQADPCMAMLNEWYATHKTSEASYGILNSLQEMDRMDAAIIVENAMKAADQVVEDEDFEYASPPAIFLSYQWGHQEEVELIRHHLEMSGYDCWMDIGQMGGGDKLFEKIDQGIRAAKIIISCTTGKYAKSPNCNREINLSVNLRKPIIPLLLEDCPWPPEGSMGPIFSEYLYIQFYQSSKDDQTPDNRFWPISKFQELLMQLNMNGIVPDESKVHKMYKNWWMPLVEEIKIDKSKTAGGGKNKQLVQHKTDNKEDDKSPDVFISYQWGKQKNIMILYKQLTELGYHCWMDIHQMGGGDSLYDKIDKGIRGCKVVLSCLTEKYTISANCRREISLCDALKRPIIPLLLEDMSWPPRGPMSMAFTELLYIDFHSNSESKMSWTGPQFDELRSKIRNYLPDPNDDGSNSSTDNKTPEGIKKDSPTADSSTDSQARKTSYVENATPGKKVNKSTYNFVDSTSKSEISSTDTSSKTSKTSSKLNAADALPSTSPAQSGTPNKPRDVGPTSASKSKNPKSSKSCTVL